MDQLLILSDLKVHREQCGHNAIYFDPKNEKQLADWHKINYIKCSGKTILPLF